MKVRAGRALGAVLFTAASSAACNADPGVECDCADPTVYIDVPSDRAASLVGVQLSGEGCATATVACLDAVDAGCARLAFRGTAIGSCTVEVELDSGPAAFEATFEFVRYPCCSGVYPELATGSTLEVPDRADAAGANE